MASMDESVLSLVGENIPISSVLLLMGVNVKNQNCGLRLKAALGNFDECYLDAMNFLTQILPIAKQHFGKHDALLLPKTPSIKRTRKHFVLDEKEPLNDMKEQRSMLPEDITNAQTNPATEPVELQSSEKPVKRVTRNSSMFPEDIKNAQTNPATEPVELQSSEKPVKRVTRNSAKERTARQTKERKKKYSIQSVSNKLENAFEKTELEENVKERESEESVCVINEPSAIGNEKEQPEAQKNLKRSSSSSPGLKRCSKRSKSGDKLPVAVESSVGQQQQSSDGEQQPTTCLSESNHKPKMERPEILTGRKSETVVVVENIGDHTVERTSVEGEKNDSGIMEFEEEVVDMETNLCSAEGRNLCDTEAKPCEDKVEEINEQKLEGLNVEKSELGKIQTNFVSSPVASNIHLDDEGMDCNSDDVAPTECSNECHNGVVHESIIVTVSPDDKTGLPANGAVDNVLNEDLPQVTVPEETLAEETTHERTKENGESSGDDIQPATNTRPWVRRSTRSSRRISRASMATQNKRRSSRRLSSQASRRSSCLKNLPATKKVNKIVPEERECSSPDSGVDRELSKLDKLAAAISEHSSIESEDEPQVKIAGPSSSTPDFQNTPKRSLRSATRMSLNTEHDKNSEGSSSNAAEPSVGKVAGIVTKINRNTKYEEQTSIVGTPNGQRKVKRIGSTIKRSTTRPCNIRDNVHSFIKRSSTKKLDADEILRLKKLELQRKEEKEKERKEQAALRRKNWAEEQKRKREEKQKKVTEAKAAREKVEKEKQQRQLEEKKQLLHVLEQTKKKKEQEDETKKKLRDQRKKEADARRLKENEERLKRLHEKEEEDRLYREMQKRKQEHEEQERKQRMLEEKRHQEQKQRDRQRDQEEERERKLREIKEREQKRLIEKVNENEKKNTEEKDEKGKKEQEERERKRIALLIKEKMDQDTKIWAEKRQKEEKERKEREEQRKLREAYKLNQSSSSTSAANKSLNQVKSMDSYPMTPPPVQTRKPSTDENYDISDIRSDESTDDEDCPRKKVPSWAQGAALKAALLNQVGPRRLFEAETGPYYPPDLDKIFHKKRKRFYQRTSSAHWDTPPIKRDVLA